MYGTENQAGAQEQAQHWERNSDKQVSEPLKAKSKKLFMPILLFFRCQRIYNGSDKLGNKPIVVNFYVSFQKVVTLSFANRQLLK